MNLFDQLVNEAVKNKPDLSSLRAVVEKELLHHDILRILSHQGLLSDLTFMGALVCDLVMAECGLVKIWISLGASILQEKNYLRWVGCSQKI